MTGSKSDKKKKSKENHQEQVEMPQTSENLAAEMLTRMCDSLENKLTEALSRGQERVVTKLSDFEATLNFDAGKIEEVSRIVEKFESKLADMEKRLQASENENKMLKARLKSVETQLNDVEQSLCNDKIEISGSVTKNTDAKQLTKVILKEAGLAQSQVEFRAETMVKTLKVEDKVEEKANVIVQFRSPKDRNEVMSRIKKEKVFNKLESVTQGKGPIFIKELLSPYYKKLFYDVNNTLKRDRDYSFLWVKEGKILVKKTTESKIQRITNMDDLEKLKSLRTTSS